MQRRERKQKIIAINPGWRYLAIAIFEECKLREWRLKSLPGRDVKKKLANVTGILDGFIKRYDSNVLAIKTFHPSRASVNLKRMTATIIDHCRKKGMSVSAYAIQEMKDAFSISRINKKELIKLLTSEYPELAHELRREERNRNPYFVRLFEAVALGHVCHKEIDNEH